MDDYIFFSCQLSSALCCLREQLRKLQVEHNYHCTRQQELQDKLKISENMILALKGRAASAKRYEEQLKLKCRSLEQALQLYKEQASAVAKVPSRECSRTCGKVELELLKDCRKKVCGLWSVLGVLVIVI